MKAAVLAAIATVCLATAAGPSEWAVGSTGGLPSPMEEYPSVQMVSAQVRVTLHPRRAQVECEFALQNTGEQTEVRIGFPESRPRGWPRENWLGGFGDFRVHVDGKAGPALPTLWEGEESQSETRWWVVKILLAEGQTCLVENSYVTPAGSVRVENSHFAYKLSTARGWSGDIDSVEVAVHTSPVRHYESIWAYPSGGVRGEGKITWQFNDFEPDDETISIEYFEAYSRFTIGRWKIDRRVRPRSGPGAPRIEDGVLMVSSSLLEMFIGPGLALAYSDLDLIVSYGANRILLTSGSHSALVNGHQLVLPRAPEIRGRHFMLPLAPVGRELGAQIRFDPMWKRTYIVSPSEGSSAVSAGAGTAQEAPQHPEVAGLAQSPWPKFRCDAQNTARGQGRACGGLKRWEFCTGDSDYFLSSPAIGPDGTLYIGCDNGKVYALDGEQGTKKWEFVARGPVFSSPAIGSDQTVYIGSEDSKVYALDGKIGAQKWAFETEGAISSSPAIGSGGTVYVASRDGSLYALSAAAGDKRWELRLGDKDWSEALPYEFQSSPAIGPDGTVYVGSIDGKVYACEASTGELKWTFETQSEVWSSPAIGSDGVVYVGSDDWNVYAIDGRAGTKRWAFKAEGPFTSSPAIGADGTVYIGCFDGRIYALDPQTGSRKWEYPPDAKWPETETAVRSSPVVSSDGAVYFGHGDCKVYALDGGTGHKKWTFLTGNVIFSSPAIGLDGTIYVGGNDNEGGKVYALR